MREILFRGKGSNTGNWFKGDLTQNDNKGYIRVSTGAIIKVKPETVGQYTGIDDKNGKMIFEGDILESRASENIDDFKQWLVIYEDGSFCFERERLRKRKAYKHEQNLLCEDNINLYELVVIGNIHDNPELLEVKE